MNFEELALDYHKQKPRGKIATKLTKKLESQDDLAIAYSPGVAGPCREIHKDKENAFLYTGRSNLVGVVTNGSAVLGLGNIGPEAAKPVMEGKAMLFKKFANIDCFDIELQCSDSDSFVAAVRALEPTFGGINLEDIKAPECFYIEETLREQMSIPVFHDDQHGTAIIAAAGFLNALEIARKSVADVKVVFSGAGAAAIATAELFIQLGVKKKNLLVCDSKGVIFKGRADGMNPYKERFATESTVRTLREALVNADAFVGVSTGNLLDQDMVRSMAKSPIIFALANPDPEILPPQAHDVRSDVIIATGRSDFPNQVNNVLGFPFIFRGALDVGATTINEQMKLAAVKAIADLAKEDVPEIVLRVYAKKKGYQFGRDYLIPKPVDPRVLTRVAPAVAKAAMDSGVARREIDIEKYTYEIERILGPSKRILRQIKNSIFTWHAKTDRKPVIVLPHGHDSRFIKAASQIAAEGDISLVLLGSARQIRANAEAVGIPDIESKVTILDHLHDERAEVFAEELFTMRQRKGVSRGSAMQLLRNQNYFGGMLVRNGFADGMVTGLGEPYAVALRPLLEVLGTSPDETLAGIQMIIYEDDIYFFADCTINIEPSSHRLADIAENAAKMAERYVDRDVKVAFLSYTSFGANKNETSQRVVAAVSELERRKVPFAFDGEIQADAALNEALQSREFPFCRLQGKANVLIFPDLTSANISYKLIGNLSEASIIGPILLGGRRPYQILERGATVENAINLIYLTADAVVRSIADNTESQGK